jgi:hypothetical protein
VATAIARQKYDWEHTSNLMALIANCHRGKDSGEITAEMFNPTIPKPERKRKTFPITVLRDVFIGAEKNRLLPGGFAPRRGLPPGTGTAGELIARRDSLIK